MVTAILNMRRARVLLAFAVIVGAAALLGGDRADVSNWTILADALLIVFASVLLFVLLRVAVYVVTAYPSLMLWGIRLLRERITRLPSNRLKRAEAVLDDLPDRLGGAMALAALVLSIAVFASFRHGKEEWVRTPLEIVIGAGIGSWLLLMVLVIPVAMVAVLRLAVGVFDRSKPQERKDFLP
ncbi:MAG: hypothetical protein AB1744_01580 [Candidatus Zixiibacteriota bacterium]